MARDLNLVMSLLARDSASKVIRQALRDIARETQATQRAGDAQARAQERNATAGIRASRALSSEAERAGRQSRARALLDIRSQHEITREIQQTIAAYNRLTRSGSLSAAEQGRAFVALKNQLHALRTELTGVSQTMTGLQRLQAGLMTASGVAGGFIAGAHVLSQYVSPQMNYEMQVALTANKAYGNAEQPRQLQVAARRAGIRELKAIIEQSVMTGGGKRDDAAAALDYMISTGMPVDATRASLPSVMKYHSATGASAFVLSEAAVAMNRFGINGPRMNAAFNEMISSGNMGAFEVEDMARYLPEILPLAKQMGLQGEQGLATLFGQLQAMRMNTGTSSGTATNYVDLAGYLMSPFAMRTARRYGINLPASLMRGAQHGLNPLDTAVLMVDQVMKKNPKWKSLENELKTAQSDDDRQRIVQAQANLLEGTVIGKFFHNQQARMGLIAYRNNREFAREVEQASLTETRLPEGQRTGDIGFDVVSQLPAFRTQQLQNEKEFAEMKAVTPLADALGDLSLKLTDYAKQYPGLTTALADAEIAIKSMTAAALVFAGLNFLSRGLPGAAGGGLAGGAAGMGIRNPGLLARGGIYGAIAAILGLAGYTAYEQAERDSTPHDYMAAFKSHMSQLFHSDKKLSMEDFGLPEFNWHTTLTDKPADTVPVIKPIDAFPDPDAFSPEYLKRNRPPVQDTGGPDFSRWPLTFTTKVILDGHEIATAVNEYNAGQATRGPQ